MHAHTSTPLLTHRHTHTHARVSHGDWRLRRRRTHYAIDSDVLIKKRFVYRSHSMTYLSHEHLWPNTVCVRVCVYACAYVRAYVRVWVHFDFWFSPQEVVFYCTSHRRILIGNLLENYVYRCNNYRDTIKCTHMIKKHMLEFLIQFKYAVVCSSNCLETILTMLIIVSTNEHCQFVNQRISFSH